MFERSIGDSTYRAQKLSNGTFHFERRFENAPGAQFDEVGLDEVPIDVISAVRKHYAQPVDDTVPLRDPEDDMA